MTDNGIQSFRVTNTPGHSLYMTAFAGGEQVMVPQYFDATDIANSPIATAIARYLCNVTDCTLLINTAGELKVSFL